MNENIQNYLTTIADNQQGVYDAGIEQGKKQEYNDFWDGYLSDDYRQFSYAFAGEGWTDKNFRPNKDIIPRKGANFMFSQSLITNLEALIERQGIVFDLSNAQRVDYMFSSCRTLTQLPVLNFSKATTNSFQQTFYYCTNLHTIRKLILPVENANRTNLYLNTFNNCSSLANIEVEGNIVQTISFSSSPLTVASMKSIISCLKDFTDTSDVGKYTVTFKRYDSSIGYTAFEDLEAEGATAEYNGTPCTWLELIAHKKWNLG